MSKLIPPAPPAVKSAALLFFSMFLMGCSGPAYYMQAVSGHWKLMHARQDVGALLEDPSSSPELVQNLESARQIVEFAETMLDLPANGSYSSYVELDDNVIAWNVIATGEFSLAPKKWCFPVAGCLPYRGFFAQQKAQKSATKLRDKGMDVHVAAATAYSTLGKFRDPLLSSMFTGSDTRLAAYLFHELAHQRLYIKGDGRFNESYASFVEQAGVLAWLKNRQQADELKWWQHLQDVDQDFTSLVGDTRRKLADLYGKDLSESAMRQQKSEILAGQVSSHKELIRKKWAAGHYFSAWIDEPVNNARLALFNTYQSGHCVFQALLDSADGNMPEFHRLAKQQAELKKEQRDKWLNQSCTVIASASKL
jgi:predicted aminopeptidase